MLVRSTGLGDEDVARLDVAVEDARPVGVVEAAGELGAQAERAPRRQPLLLLTREPRSVPAMNWVTM